MAAAAKGRALPKLENPPTVDNNLDKGTVAVSPKKRIRTKKRASKAENNDNTNNSNSEKQSSEMTQTQRRKKKPQNVDGSLPSLQHGLSPTESGRDDVCDTQSITVYYFNIL